jgi:hypothetical protein
VQIALQKKKLNQYQANLKNQLKHPERSNSPKSGESTPIGASATAVTTYKVGRKNSGKSDSSGNGKMKPDSSHSLEQIASAF